VLFPVAEPSQVFQSRQIAMGLARRLGFSEIAIGKVGIVASELATNLVKHAKGGEFSATTFEENGVPGVELLSVDRGPGIADVERSLIDGVSTAGTAGNGLGAVRRLADRFCIESKPGIGTVLMARLAKSPPAADRGPLQVGACVSPFPGESVSGDAWGFRPVGDGGMLMMADGLGHGPAAAAAAQKAIGVLHETKASSAVEVATEVHRALHGTRGAAVAVADIKCESARVAFVGIGNISAVVSFAGTTRSMVSHHGTAGVTARRIAEFVYPFTVPAVVIMHSDGISARWQLSDYPGLERQDASVIAAVLYRDFARGRDDAAAAVVQVHR
jgi:anti-sigma regulatory factor (Ser/Thr protein kinase)